MIHNWPQNKTYAFIWQVFTSILVSLIYIIDWGKLRGYLCQILMYLALSGHNCFFKTFPVKHVNICVVYRVTSLKTKFEGFFKRQRPVQITTTDDYNPACPSGWLWAINLHALTIKARSRVPIKLLFPREITMYAIIYSHYMRRKLKKLFGHLLFSGRIAIKIHIYNLNILIIIFICWYITS